MDEDNEIDEAFNESTIAEHPLKGVKPQKKGFNHNEVLQRCENYLKNELATQTCRSVFDHIPTKCTCLSFMETEADDSEIREIARYMIYFKGMKQAEQNQKLSEWHRIADVLKRLCGFKGFNYLST